MRESVAVAKEADREKEFSPTKSSNSNIQRLRDEADGQLVSLGGVLGNIRSNGDAPSVESIAMQMSGVSAAQRAPVLSALQQTHGNRYVQRVVSGIQAKLKVGQPGDKYEQEADRVADAVMRMPEPNVQREVDEEEEEELLQTKPLVEQITPLVQRQVEEEEEEFLQAKSRDGASPEVAHDLESEINAIRGGGQSLSGYERSFFEPRFGYDFSQVRVHSGAQAARLTRAVNARAFTVDRDVVFGAGLYAPETSEGRRLLAHELTHIVQQSASGKPANILQRQDEAESRPNSRRFVPQEMDPEAAAEFGEIAVNEIGYENLMNIAKQQGLIREKHVDEGGSRIVQKQISSAPVMLQGQFLEVLTPYAVAAGIASQVDSPAPGPGDVVGLGILLVGLVVATAAVVMTLSLAECIEKYVDCTDYTPSSPCGDCLHYCRAQGEWPSERCP